MTDLTQIPLENIKVDVEKNGLAIVTLARSEARNALDESMIDQLIRLFYAIGKSDEVSAVVMRAEGPTFCAGLDLKEHYYKDRSSIDFMRVCRGWHEAFNNMQFSGKPIVSALKGAVVGGGLELASAAHIRVADATTYFALPEGQRGIFTGGGATVRVADMVGKARMVDMMLTGRIYQGQEAVDVGLCQYLVDEGESETLAMELGQKIAENLPLTNMAITLGIEHSQNVSSYDAYFSEAFIAGIVNTQPDARERLAAFANKTAKKTKPDN